VAAHRGPSDRKAAVIRDWPVWAQVLAVLGWCAAMGALGGFGIALILAPVRRSGRHRR